MEGKQLAINIATVAVVCLVVGGVSGFFLSDGVPNVIRLSDGEADGIRFVEAQNCNVLLIEKGKESESDVELVKADLVDCEERFDKTLNLNNVAWSQVDSLRSTISDVSDVVSDLNLGVGELDC